MSRGALVLVVLFHLSSAMAHPGHDAPEPHLHALWEAVLLVALIALFVVIRTRRRSLRREQKARANSAVT